MTPREEVLGSDNLMVAIFGKLGLLERRKWPGESSAPGQSRRLGLNAANSKERPPLCLPVFVCRHRLLPPVCQRWRLLSTSPALLQQAEMYLTVGNTDHLPRLRSLCAFLQRHAGQHLRSLHLNIYSFLKGSGDGALVAANVSACAALEKPTLRHMPMPISAALAPSVTFLRLKLPDLSIALPSQVNLAG